jgi:hypothetical protein
MKKSRSVTLALVGSALIASGCGSRSTTRTFYDKAGNPVPRSQWKKADGTPNELYDAQGNLIPQEEVSQAYSSTTGSSTTSYRRSSGGSGFFWGAMLGRSMGSSSHGYSGGSSSPSGGGSVSRGGFGSTGGSHGSSSS